MNRFKNGNITVSSSEGRYHFSERLHSIQWTRPIDGATRTVILNQSDAVDLLLALDQAVNAKRVGSN